MPYGWTDQEWQTIIAKEQQDDLDADQRSYDTAEARMLQAEEGVILSDEYEGEMDEILGYEAEDEDGEEHIDPEWLDV